MPMLSNSYRVVRSWSVYRGFRTNCQNLIPRGLTNTDRRDGINQCKEYSHSELPPNHVPKAEKDIRSVDSVDPIILKYTKFLNELGYESGQPQEKVYPTDFGSIRFDSDNAPGRRTSIDIMTLGTGDVIFNGSSQTSQKEDLSARVSHISNTNSQEADGLSPQAAVVANHNVDSNIHEDERAFEELFSGSITEYEAHHEKNTFLTDTQSFEYISKKQDTNSIDEQYFDIVIQNSNSDLNNQQVPKHCQQPLNPEYLNRVVSSSRKMNIDNQDVSIFDDRYYSTANSNKISYTNFNSEHSDTVDFSKSSEVQDIYNTEDMNYIDQIYFSPDFESLRDKSTPVVDYSEMKYDIERAFDNLKERDEDGARIEKIAFQKSRNVSLDANNMHESPAANIALNYLGVDAMSVQPPKIKAPKKGEQKEMLSGAESAPKTAYDYVLKKRKEEHKLEFGFGKEDENDPGNRSYLKILSLMRDTKKDTFTKHDMLSLLKGSIIYDAHGIIGLHKPYGVSMHEGTSGPHHTLTDFLPQLARHIECEELFVVHRLDATSTGVLLLARTPSMAYTLKNLLKKQQIKKTYWAITKGIPSPLYGSIEIPIAEGSVDGKYRMILSPDIEGMKGSQLKAHFASTGFQVLSKAYNTALVELTPKTGVKHQLRVHLGFGLSCPILGDHKYSHLKKLAPQKLPGDALERLKLKQSKVRNLPLFLHSRSVVIPEIIEGRNIFIKAKLPAFFNKALSALKLNTHKNRVRYQDGKCLDD
ncbi:Mitochondrial RNA pseudouridine synthase rpusd4 [Halocaridina rubra]|uniref:Pseudouridylate synthase RPUSD4, mitochondrial n=1 Tax=Halocaridina rubra TaxID=373956 RepID=A0AAN8WXX2_HALRR